MSLRGSLCGMVVVLGTVILTGVAAQGSGIETKSPIDPKSPGVINLNEAQQDPDFQYLGEYRGYWSAGDRAGEGIGMQVTPLGDGKFQAMEYRGGLPGGNWNRSERRWWEGVREGSGITLKTIGLQARLENQHITLQDATGRALGDLAMVRRRSSTIGLTPPSGAIVLFDGKSTSHWEGARVTSDGLLMEGAMTKGTFRDFKLHVEFQLSYNPFRRDQGRSNSGVYLQERYEVQVLDSFGLVGAFNECGSLYRTVPPLQNMCLPPLQWQTYDIEFYAARFDDWGNRVRPTEITVWHNGVVIHDHLQIPNKTGAGKPEGPEPRLIKLQDHHNPVRYRNIWLQELNGDNREFSGAVCPDGSCLP